MKASRKPASQLQGGLLLLLLLGALTQVRCRTLSQLPTIAAQRSSKRTSRSLRQFAYVLLAYTSGGSRDAYMGRFFRSSRPDLTSTTPGDAYSTVSPPAAAASCQLHPLLLLGTCMGECMAA
ncbi:hypothetical protein V8C86DRAFT_2779724 [Haematococcus lacustris]